MSAVSIREAGPEDAPAIERVVEAAFGRFDEAQLVDALTGGGHAVLALVAVDGAGSIVGHVLFSRLAIEGAGSPLKATALAPVSVLPACQRQGIGHALIRAGHDRLASLGEDLVLVLGDPDYYRRSGYGAELGARFECPWPGPYFMGCALRPLDEAALSGRVVYPAPFLSLA